MTVLLRNIQKIKYVTRLPARILIYTECGLVERIFNDWGHNRRVNVMYAVVARKSLIMHQSAILMRQV